MRRLTFKHALTPDGIVPDCMLEIGGHGEIIAIGQGKGPYDGDLLLPGMPNAHSHAFQRAMAGHGEARRGEDSFWSWREAMYRLAGRVTPEQMYAIARQAYMEMLIGGFTSVAEFHYLHHLPDGSASTDMADAVVAAAHDVGIRLRLLPVFYQTGGFGQPASPAQARFVHESVDGFLQLLFDIDHPHIGLAPHSLRAVPLEQLRELDRISRAGTYGLMHIHVSEQRAEVEQCVAAYGKRPVHLLAETVELDGRWNLVHATHADEAERNMISSSGARVVLCPLTEAYLGDGLFEAAEFHAAGGSFAIGSDSNARIDAIEELRWLEYGQRLRDGKRARLADESGIGHVLWRSAAAGGARATGFGSGRIAVGEPADLVVLDVDAAPWRGLPVSRRLDAWLTGGSRADIAKVLVGGEVLVEHGEYRDADSVRAGFDKAMAEVHS